jgi:hypothetical protein
MPRPPVYGRGQRAQKTVTAWVALNISESRPRRGPVRPEHETQAGTLSHDPMLRLWVCATSELKGLE